VGKLVILSGPSCVGKGPLHAALVRHHPALASRFGKLVLYNSRAPRPGEKAGVDYHFRSRREIQRLRRKGFALFEVRGDLQAVDLKDLGRRLKAGEDLFFEGNPFVADALLSAFRSATPTTVFLSPLSRDEILNLKKAGVDLPGFVADLMRRKLLRRMVHQKGILSLPDLEEVERRCRSAYRELGYAWKFQHILPNHDGEDSENWGAFCQPVGDARRTLNAFVEILEGDSSPLSERWEMELIEPIP